uniref:response regulator transcription factor n=1 Tax=Paractinoplanes polyasparticus TaxID=2856853 RepID=UPI001C8563DC|nr:response regulator [Actinoplanes polyasparticus]
MTCSPSNWKRPATAPVTTDNGNRNSAVTLTYHEQPDLIVLDIGLPGMDGLSVCHRLHSDRLTAQIPTLLLSSHTRDTDVSLGYTVGADHYMTKPFSLTRWSVASTGCSCPTTTEQRRHQHASTGLRALTGLTAGSTGSSSNSGGRQPCPATPCSAPPGLRTQYGPTRPHGRHRLPHRRASGQNFRRSS